MECNWLLLPQHTLLPTSLKRRSAIYCEVPLKMFPSSPLKLRPRISFAPRRWSVHRGISILLHMDGHPGTHRKNLVQGAPAKALIFERTQASQGQPTARRSFYKSNTAQLIWNKGSTGLLVLAHSDVDKTNQSYYGETRLHFLTSDGKHEGAVPLSMCALSCLFLCYSLSRFIGEEWFCM